MKHFIFILFVLLSFSVTGQEKDTLWDYPVKPGSQEWASFTTGRQMLDACQIPENILKTLSTKDLVKICLNYPLFFDYVAANDERKGISFMIESFNGLNELSKRKDGVLELINAYNEYPVITQVQQESSKDYYTPYKLPFIELLLADDIFEKQLDSQKSGELEKIVLKKYESKLKYPQVYSLYNIKKTFLLGSVILNGDNSRAKTATEKDTIKRFIENYNNVDATLLTEISKIISEL